MNTDNLLKERWRREQVFLTNLKKTKPKLFNQHIVSPQNIHEQIGITSLPLDLPKGYIHFKPSDFIVEEVWGNKLSMDETGQNVFCDLIKVNISTYDAIEQIAESLNIPVTKIHFAGSKDVNAVTLQKISISGVLPADIKKIKSDNFALKNVVIGSGALSPDELTGHKYTVTVRTGQKILEGRLHKRMETMQKDGFINYYGTQRFGSPRFISHDLGKYLLQGNFKRAIKTFLYYTTAHELPAVAVLRRKARANYGDWAETKRLFSNFPYMLRNELTVLDYLIENPTHFAGALKTIEDQAKIWVYAYGSFLHNKVLSVFAHNENLIPKALPTIIIPDREKIKVFEPLLREDEIDDYYKTLNFLGISPRESYVPTKVVYDFNIKAKQAENSVVLSFTLPKGAYANVLLSNLFQTYVGWPVPEWVKNSDIDSKKILGDGSISEFKKTFGEILDKPITFNE